jgi:2-polyprenyl-3-methyl-5-hydroxy-6-metoxy-1,4-benzoquinol methylase
VDLGIPRLGDAVHPAYANPRPEVTAVVPSWATRVLDVGCSVGSMGAALRERGHIVTGIEYEPELAAEARKSLDRVIEGDVEQLARDSFDPGAPFDCVCFADVLEHLRDPWSVVRWAEGLLAPSGVVVASVPNIARLETLWNVFGKRVFPYQPVGVFDRTHLRFFARRNLPQLFDGTALQIKETRRVYLLSFKQGSLWNKIAPIFGDLATLQFVMLAQSPGEGG